MFCTAPRCGPSSSPTSRCDYIAPGSIPFKAANSILELNLFLKRDFRQGSPVRCSLRPAVQVCQDHRNRRGHKNEQRVCPSAPLLDAFNGVGGNLHRTSIDGRSSASIDLIGDLLCTLRIISGIGRKKKGLGCIKSIGLREIVTFGQGALSSSVKNARNVALPLLVTAALPSLSRFSIELRNIPSPISLLLSSTSRGYPHRGPRITTTPAVINKLPNTGPMKSNRRPARVADVRYQEISRLIKHLSRYQQCIRRCLVGIPSDKRPGALLRDQAYRTYFRSCSLSSLEAGAA